MRVCFTSRLSRTASQFKASFEANTRQVFRASAKTCQESSDTTTYPSVGSPSENLQPTLSLSGATSMYQVVQFSLVKTRTIFCRTHARRNQTNFAVVEAEGESNNCPNGKTLCDYYNKLFPPTCMIMTRRTCSSVPPCNAQARAPGTRK